MGTGAIKWWSSFPWQLSTRARWPLRRLVSSQSLGRGTVRGAGDGARGAGPGEDAEENRSLLDNPPPVPQHPLKRLFRARQAGGAVLRADW